MKLIILSLTIWFSGLLIHLKAGEPVTDKEFECAIGYDDPSNDSQLNSPECEEIRKEVAKRGVK